MTQSNLPDNEPLGYQSFKHDDDVCGLDSPTMCEGCVFEFRNWQRAYRATYDLLKLIARRMEEFRRDIGALRHDVDTLADEIIESEGRVR